ncbi:PREDICTED: putative nuclease HARBI1 [Trachymyrmex cornetzi]|uniref:putative nuclease HARBI1 n=1 Tax=Trachymyrmex cornetzi TaxID=471704 RepID=UPI00084F20D6|nr:PREDICTED: putative nuclease HARBI1 [Trachymyrmex cornetzi]
MALGTPVLIDSDGCCFWRSPATVIELQKKGGKQFRKYWVRPIFTESRRLQQGASDNLIEEMESDDVEKYHEYFRMSPELFYKLLELVRPDIEKQCVVRAPISAKIRLQITLRYLSSGDSMKSLSYAFRVGHNTISKCIHSTCEAIWNHLKDSVFIKDNEESWKDIAKDYEDLWDFPNCIGAIDGKHVMIQAPPNSGSSFYNYKGHHSINLLAVCDARYCFTMVDIGAKGRESDGGVFAHSEIGKRFENGSFNLPPSQKVGSSGPVAPFVLVADEAFPLTTYMMRPFPRSGNLNIEKKIFNYRLSRARRIIESAFGILVARWRIYSKSIFASVRSVRKIVQATVVLHNFIIQNEKVPIPSNSTIRENVRTNSSGLWDINPHTGRNKREAITVRNAFTEYFNGLGAVEFQWQKALSNDF